MCHAPTGESVPLPQRIGADWTSWRGTTVAQRAPTLTRRLIPLAGIALVTIPLAFGSCACTGEGTETAHVLNLDDMTSAAVAHVYCGGAPDECHDEVTYTVDFVTARLDVETCQPPKRRDAGDAGERQTATTAHRDRQLTANEVSGVREALAKVTFSERDALQGSDGRTDFLIVFRNGAMDRYVDVSYCAEAKTVVQGLGDVWDAITRL